MLKVLPFATALAVVGAACYVLGVLLALLAPGLYLGLFESWALLDVAALAPGGVLVTPIRFIAGLVTVTLASWLFGWAWAALYNTFGKTWEASRLETFRPTGEGSPEERRAA